MKFYSFITTLLFSSVLIAQTNVPVQPELESGTVESQFDYIIEKSSSFKDFQLIRRTSILKVKSNALDSLKILRAKAKNGAENENQLKTQIEALKSEVVTLQKQINDLQKYKDSISVLGGTVEKSFYNTFLWTIILVLVAALVFFVLRFNGSNVVTKRTKRELEKMESEFEEHRKKSLKKEQEIMRRLQDEINKNNS